MFDSNSTSATSAFKLRINFNLKDISNVGGHRSQIWLSTTINKERVRIYTGQLVYKEHWVKSNRSEIGGGYAIEDNSLDRVTLKANKVVNKALKKILKFVENYVKLVCNNHLLTTDTAIFDNTPANFKEYIISRIEGKDYKGATNPETFIRGLIDRKKEEVNVNTRRILCKGTIYNHTNALNRLITFLQEKNLRFTWGVFDSDFERSFTAWMNDRQFTPNTIASQFSIIKVWLRAAQKAGVVENNDFQSYHTATHDVDNIYLTEEEIKKIYDLDASSLEINSQSQIEETRDLFIIGCYTGLRYSDYHSLPAMNDGDETISLRMQKTNETVVIPLHPYVKAIYHKYNGQLPKPIDKGKAIKNIQICARAAGIDSNYTITRVVGGRNETLSKPKWEFISNHTARRSFATNMYLRGIPTISIMAITGHKTESVFMHYIKVDKAQHARIVGQAFARDAI